MWQQDQKLLNPIPQKKIKQQTNLAAAPQKPDVCKYFLALQKQHNRPICLINNLFGCIALKTKRRKQIQILGNFDISKCRIP